MRDAKTRVTSRAQFEVSLAFGTDHRSSLCRCVTSDGQMSVALHRQGNTVALEVPLERFSVHKSRNRVRQCLVVALVASFVLAVVAYVAAPVGLFLLQAVFNQKNERLERLVYHIIPEVVSFFLMLCLGIVMIYVGVRMMQQPMTG
jgi:hypothetical protein